MDFSWGWTGFIDLDYHITRLSSPFTLAPYAVCKRCKSHQYTIIVIPLIPNQLTKFLAHYKRQFSVSLKFGLPKHGR